MHDNKGRIGRAISGVVIFTFAAKILGFCRELLLSYFFGATGISDAYLISQNIPGTLFQIVGVGLTTCFIPIYYKVKNDNGDINKFTNRVLTIVFSFSTILISIVWAATPFIVKLFASGFKGETLYYAIWFTRIGILSLYFSSMIYVYNSYLQANNLFYAQAFAAIPNSLFIMVSIYFGSKYNLWLLSIGSTLAVGVQLQFLIPSIKKTEYKFGLQFDWKDPYIKKFFKMMTPVIVGVSVNELNTLIDRTVASQVAVGGISALTYANSLINFIQGGLVQPVATVFYPKITETVSNKKYQAGRNLMNRAINLVLGLLIPITIGFLVLSSGVVKFLFGRGAFDENAAKLTSIAVVFYAVGICFVGLREFISRYYYANGNSKTPMINTSIGVVINIILNLILSKWIGIGGLALATSISAIVTSILLVKNTHTKITSGAIDFDVEELGKIILSSVVMGIVCYLVYSYAPVANNTLLLLMTVTVGVTVYFIFGYALRIQIVSFLMNFVKRR